MAIKPIDLSLVPKNSKYPTHMYKGLTDNITIDKLYHGLFPEYELSITSDWYENITKKLENFNMIPDGGLVVNNDTYNIRFGTPTKSLVQGETYISIIDGDFEGYETIRFYYNYASYGSYVYSYLGGSIWICEFTVNSPVTRSEVSIYNFPQAKTPKKNNVRFWGLYKKSDVLKVQLTTRKTLARVEVYPIDAKLNHSLAVTSQAMNNRLDNNDPYFKSGYNSINLYNNSGNGNVKIRLITPPSDAPTVPGGRVLEVKNIGSSSPGCGGFHFQEQTYALNVFYYTMVAKIPVGRNLKFASNAIGNGGSHGPITNMSGTGKYETYIYRVTCGNGGTLSTTGFFYIDGAFGTPTAPVVWYVAFAESFKNIYNLQAPYSDTPYTISASKQFYTTKSVSFKLDPSNQGKFVYLELQRKPSTWKTASSTESLPYSRTVVNDVNVRAEKSYVKTAGKNGTKTKYVDEEFIDGVKTGIIRNKRESITVQPVNEVYVQGTAKIEWRREVYKTSPEPYLSLVMEDPNLYRGETKLIRDGVNGVRSFYQENEYMNGVKTGAVRNVDTVGTITTPTLDKITAIGTKPKNILSSTKSNVIINVGYTLQLLEPIVNGKTYIFKSTANNEKVNLQLVLPGTGGAIGWMTPLIGVVTLPYQFTASDRHNQATHVFVSSGSGYVDPAGLVLEEVI